MNKKIILALLLAASILCFGSCDQAEKDPGTSDTKEEMRDDTAEPAETVPETKPVKETEPGTEPETKPQTEPQTEPETEPPVTYPVNGYGKLEGEALEAYRKLLPDHLPDDSEIGDFARGMCFDDPDGTTYSFDGHSSPTLELVDTDNGALYGQAARFASAGQNAEKRAEITVISAYENNVGGAKGIMFWVDLSHVIPAEGKTQCASVTVNDNQMRCTTGVEGEITAYYYQDGEWVESTNVTSCRIALPDGFRGWIYVPGESYYFTNPKGDDGRYLNKACDENGILDPFEVINMRCYTDGYTYSYGEYIIFDEILFIY